MLNITLTLTAAPELLAAMSTFINAITAAQVVTIPEYNEDFNFSKNEIAATCQQENTVVQQATMPTKSAIPTQGIMPAQGTSTTQQAMLEQSTMPAQQTSQAQSASQTQQATPTQLTSTTQQGTLAQSTSPAQLQVPANTRNLYNQPSNAPVFPVQTPKQAASQVAPTEGIAVPTTVQSYTMEQLAVAATQIMDAGRRTELVGLLSSFGVQALTALPKNQYGAFATELRALGAKI